MTRMTEAALPPLRLLADYRPPEWLVERVNLAFELDAERTVVRARLEASCRSAGAPLVLDGEALVTRRLVLDGAEQPLPPPGDGPLVLQPAAERTIVESEVELAPAHNHQLMGLYASGGVLCTQCEPEGFRRITWFPDRPDVMARYSVTLVADPGRYPVLLAGGDETARETLADGRVSVRFDDPWPKPSYLFALVAGDLAARRATFTTRSGRDVACAIWTAAADVPRSAHAMRALLQAMAWDEEVYGREYDLDAYHIVAVHDFNFGAMENKGLNIFNARYVLADPESATDADLDAVSAVIAHEYFHNWSGNRVTLRDWFQLALKEGFTVLRDQQFQAAIGSPAVRRIEEVRQLRASQWAEDDGPHAHPVRPDRYREISNFYTATVYSKGAEVARMIARLLGAAAFRRATDRFFDAHDGRAATVEDFLDAMAAEGLDRERFARWYAQRGTPVVSARLEHQPHAGRARLSLAQANPREPGADPLLIPLELALFARSGRRLAGPVTLVMGEREAAHVFEGVDEPPLLSINRGFTAPVRVNDGQPPDARIALALVDDDPVARWDALQTLGLELCAARARGEAADPAPLVEGLRRLLTAADDDPALAAEALLLPAETVVGDTMPLVDPLAIRSARHGLRQALKNGLDARLWELFHARRTDPADLSAEAKGWRRLKSVALGLLMADDADDATAAALLAYADARSMTERMGALVALASSNAVERLEALADFHRRWRHDPLVLDKWFQVQAMAERADTAQVVAALARHPDFDPLNPNRLRALMGGFAANQGSFHDAGGRGCRLLADTVLTVDRANPQSAARLAQPLGRWARLVQPFAGLLRAELERMAGLPLSRELADMVGRSLEPVS